MTLEITPPQPQTPRCPYCGHQPLNFAQNMIVAANGSVCSIIWCGDCGHTISMQYVGQRQVETGPRIVRPS